MMSRFLFLLFLVSFLLLADSASYTLTGELQSWTGSGNSDFNLNAVTGSYSTIFSSTLDLFGYPTYAGSGTTNQIASAASFYQWWNTPISQQGSLTPFSIVMNDETPKFVFDRTSGFFPISGVRVFSFHVRGELNCGSTCSPSALQVQTSDDFAMYVDGTLVCSSSGITSSSTTITCNIPTLASGLPTAHYVDIFYARRSTASPAALYFELPGAATSCSLFSRSILTRNIYPFGAGNLQPFANAFVYNLTNSQPQLNLVKPSDTSSATAVYSSTPIRYQNGFSTHFRFNITGANAEGFAFVVQSNSNQGPVSGSGAGLGYAISKSLAVEFDTSLSATLGTGCDLAVPHVEIHTVLNGANTACRTSGITAFTTFATNTVSYNFTNGSTYEAYIEYLPGSGTGTISAWAAPDGKLGPSGTYQGSRFTSPNNNFLARATIPNSALQTMFGTSYVYPGFTASATTSGTNVYIWDWTVNTVPIGAFNTQGVSSVAGSSQVARNSQGSKSFTITLQDACGGVIPIGTDPVTATLSTAAISGNTAVVDDKSGSYDITWWYTLAANFNLTVMVYGQSVFMGVAPYYYPSPYNVSIVPDVINAPNCYFTPATNLTTNFLASETRMVTITARDQFNNTVSTPSNGFTAFFATFPASDTITASSQSGPNYIFNVGTHVAYPRSQIFFRYSGTDIAGSPTAYLNVTAGWPADAYQTAVTLIGTGLQGSVAGVPATIAFQVLDSWANTWSTVVPFNVTASMACAPGFTDSRCNNPALVSITILKNKGGDGSFFSVIWTTPAVGPCYTVNISIFPAVNGSNGGDQLPGLPQVCVLPNNVSVTNSILNTGTSYTAGSLGTLTIQAKDAYNNSRTSDNSPLLPFTVLIGNTTTAVSIICSSTTSTSTSTPSVANLACSYSGVGGVYQVSFTPRISGSQTVTVSLGAAQITGTINVAPGPGYAPNDIISNFPSTMVAGQSKTFSFSSQDIYHNLRLNGTDTGSFVVTMLPVGQSSGTAVVGSVTPQGDGSYSVSITGYLAVNHTVDVKLLGTAVSNSPQFTLVFPGVTNLTDSLASGDAQYGGVGNTSVSFALAPYDSFGNLQNHWPDSMTCTICSGGTCGAATTPCRVTASGTANYTITYTVPVWQAAPNNLFTLNLSDIANNSGITQLRVFNMASSQNAVNQNGILTQYYANGAAPAIQCNSKSTIPYNTLNNSLTAGQLFTYYYVDFSNSGCTGPITYTASQAPQVNIDFTSVVSAQTKFSANVQYDTAKTAAASPVQAIFNVSVIGTKVGVYKITVLANGFPTAQSNGGIFAQVIPGPLDPPSCIVSPSSVTVYAGNPTSWTISLKDAYGNDLANSQDYSNQFVLLVRNQQGQNVTTQLLNANFAYSSSSPIINVTYAPTVAGVGSMALYGPSTTNGLQLIASKTFPVTVLAGPVNPTYTCYWTPSTGTANNCPSYPIQTATAGQGQSVPLYARDLYNNPVNDATLNFTLAIPSQTVTTVSSVFSGSAGLYTVTFATNKTVYPGSLSATASNPQGLVAATTTINVQPASLSSMYSYVVGLNTTSYFIAGSWVNWTLFARDIYNNEWFNTSAYALQVDVQLDGPETATRTLVSAGTRPTKGYITGAFTNPNAQYNYQYIPVTASTNDLTNIDPYAAIFLYNGVVLSNISGNVPFLVFPSIPDPTQTLIPAVPSLINAGQMTNLTITLRDTYGNNIINGSAVTGSAVDIEFYNGPGTQCSGSAINPSYFVANFTNRRGYIHLDQYVNDLGNGQYNLTIWTVVAGQYFAGISVNGNLTTICRQISTVFTVQALDVNGSHSEISGQAIDNPDDNIAGTDLSLYLVLRDKYDNIVNKRDQTILIGATPVDRPTICPTGDGLSWLTDSGSPYNGSQISYFTYQDNKNGSWNLDFEVYRAATYHLVVLVNTSTVQNQAIGPGCYNLTVVPWYVYTWDATPPTLVQEALTTSLIVYGKDRYGNNVTHGNHYWTLVYTRTTVDQLAPYGFARNTPTTSPYEVFYNAEHYGDYNAYVTLVQDPLYADPNKYPVGTASNTTTIHIDAASCARASNSTTPLYRCPDLSFDSLGSCTSSWATCGYTAATTPCPAGSTTCTSPAGSYCGNSCPPSGSSSDFPPWATVMCPNSNYYRMSSAECPTMHVCPTGWTVCADGRSCSPGGTSACPAAPTCTSGYACANGACVAGPYDCPTDVTCSTGAFICEDGTCVSSGASCPSLFLCAPPNTARCSDGSCRASAADCPTAVTCPRGYAKCETGHCVQSISECTTPTTCAVNQVHCSDGTCRDNLALCPSSITCPAGRPVLCEDRSCVAYAALCREPMECDNETLPYLCPGGTCAYSQVECPTSPTCPLDTPVLCEDMTCAQTLAKCNSANALSATCPPHRPYNCPDGSCSNAVESCPTLGHCGVDTPVRCTTATCAVAGNVCPLQSQLNCPGVLCPGGGCASALSQCPTAITCPSMYERCSDGSCRANCSTIQRASNTWCTYPYYECPGHEAGFSCVLDPTTCPQSPTCPFDRPIRCVDRSCAASEELCPPAPVYASGISTCAANTFTSTNNCPSSAGVGSTTCPWGWAKCWDETCRLIAEDCPPQPFCTFNHPTPRFVAPYLCPSGLCARLLTTCAILNPCPTGQIRCPATNASSINCANSLADCSALTSEAGPLQCPFGFQLCKNGACMLSCTSSGTPVFNVCPGYLPFQCSDGKCVVMQSQCAPVKNCSRTSQLCWDKTCSIAGATSESCTDLAVSNYDLSLNMCPLSNPYRCGSGFCALSSALCPDFPLDLCSSTPSTPIRCLDGSCQMSSIQCPVIKPCFASVNQTRCVDGSCSANCTMISRTAICKGSTSFMCPNGLCASSNTTCWNERTGCSGNMTKCDDGLCSNTCSTPPQWDGCGTGTSRCYDGSCSASCPPPTSGCNPADPAGDECEWQPCASPNFRCGNGACVASVSDASCKTAWNCPYLTPFRGVDGGCYNYPAPTASPSKKMAAASVPQNGTVVCPSTRPHVCKDGSCVASVTHCPAVQPCGSGNSLCVDMTCGSCSTAQWCPPGSPTLCPDGSCRRSARECGQLVMAPACSKPMFQCFDGTCVNSTLDCVKKQFNAQKGASVQYSDGASVCPNSGEYLCWNGACLLLPQASLFGDPLAAQASKPVACPPVPGCPFDFPLRCWDGRCISNTSSCTASPSCGSNMVRCEDGTCRTSGQCPQYAGCPVGAPFYCAFAVNQCVASAGACKQDPTNPQVCGDNCVRDGVARAQLVTVYPATTTVVDVVLDDELAPVTQITFPPGAFQSTSPSVISINPATLSPDLYGGRARINSILVPRTPAQILLSPPFYLHGASSYTKFLFNINVTSNIDTTLYAGATVAGTVLVSNPCPIIGNWSAFGTDLNSQANCLYSLNVTNATTTMRPVSSKNVSSNCPSYSFVAQVSKVTTISDPILDIQQTCVCSNVTSPSGSLASTKGSLVCALWTTGETATTIIFPSSSNDQSVCPSQNQTNTLFLNQVQDQSISSISCTATAGLIDPKDICLCTLHVSAGKEWMCTYPAYNDRVINVPWVPVSGRPNFRVTGFLPSNQVGWPTAFCYIPLPSPPIPTSSQESWWQKYGKIVLGVGITMFVLLLILICAISRLIRYRRKYHEERAEAEELREQAQELDEKHGGLGVYDDEVEMIANPLVVEMQELQKQLEQTNAHLKTQEEMDEHQMAALDKERQRILEEIKRVKDAIAQQQKTQATRVDEIPPSGAVAVSVGSGGGNTSSGTGAERQEFNQAPTARRKKQDL